MRKTFAACALALSLTACMTMGNKFDMHDADQFVPGVTTMQQAQEKLGTPTATNAMPNGGTLQQWIYSQASMFGGTSSNIAILFDKDGKMIRVQNRGQVNTR
ncbi:outer membrane protein assembly factor BamE [Burkholderia contaminans]|uniref:Putative lipoprotein n=1 Tax=Burkholderia contaminans TaxID=488447 RepID=A0A6P2Y1X9_9BURK|nr:outer membrane protein assembly factor BamE [Burkholderia contaminans]VWD16202.1 putative lipoprotein [Burkholderia contaminans]